MYLKVYPLFLMVVVSFVLNQTTAQSVETEFRMTTDQNTGLLTVAPQLKVKPRNLNLSYEEARSFYGSAYGSPYLYDATPSVCDLLLNNGDTVFNVAVVVDAFQNELVAVVDGKEQILQTEFIKRIIPKEGSIEYPLERRVPTSSKKFCEVLYEHDVDILRVTTINLRTEGGGVPGMEKEKKRFIRVEEYFVQRSADDWTKISFSKKDEIIELLPPSEQEKWRHAMKRRGIKKIKKPKHLMAVLEFLEAESL